MPSSRRSTLGHTPQLHTPHGPGSRAATRGHLHFGELSMKPAAQILIVIVLLAGVALLGPTTPAQDKKEDPPRKRGTATVEETRPDHFPHRIWAACDFEAQTPDYAWFGPTELKNIPSYPGNRTALSAHPRSGAKFSAIKTGMNPVPGPMMGKVNKLYLRYYLKGTSEATFQHYSLSSNDNNHIRVTGLTQGKWSEATLNFTRDGRRNDGTAGIPFKAGERMDDFQLYVGKPADEVEALIDDVIFFD